MPASPVPPAASAPPKRRSALPWVLGGCGCLTLLVIAAIIGFYALYRVGKNAEETVRVTHASTAASPAETSASVESTVASGSLADNTAAGGWKTYVNVKQKLPAELQEHFVAFSFSYPPSFEMLPQDASNFVKVEKYIGGKGNTGQNFAVGYATFPPVGAELLYDTLLTQLGDQFKPNFPNYRETKRLPVNLPVGTGKALLFEAKFANNIKVYGKTMLLHPKGKPGGVTIIMLATSLDPTITSADDLGVKGETAQILQSFKFL